MRSIESSVQGLKVAGTCAAILILLLVFGLGVGWPKESAQPLTDEEFFKQEKIYSSPGDVPSGYITDRGLSGYADLLSTGFCEALGRLGSSDRWLDIGAGTGQAILDYYAPKDNAAPAEKCNRSGVKARAVAISIEDRRTDRWRERAASLGDDRMRYLSGKRFRHYTRDELGKFQIITDVFGGFSYTEDLYQLVEKVLGLLEVGGAFYTLVQNVHLEHGKDKPDTWYQTELLDPDGSSVKVCSWLKKISCVNVACESKSDWESPTELISIRKICRDVSVPRIKLLGFEAGNPPTRRFRLEP